MQGYCCSHIDQALREEWIQVYYQPVVWGMSCTLCGAEALARWIDPERGMIYPSDFIPELEESGKIFDLDLYVAEEVCKVHQQLAAAGIDPVPVSFNLSRVDFQHPDLFERIEALMERYEVPRDKLNLEITESAFVKDMDLLGNTLALFRQNGYQIWMDDFGSGFSSLGVLKDYSFDEIKIDMSFLSSASEKARVIIEYTVRMAKAIGVQTLAEGVETEEQYQFLRSIGCEKVQGYLFGKPMPGRQIPSSCRERNIAIVPSRWTNYYTALGKIDCLTDEPLAIVEDDGINLHVLFANERIKEVYRSDGVASLEDWERKLNAHGGPIHILHRNFVDKQLHEVGDTQTLTYPSGDHYMQLTAQVVARCGRRSIYRSRLNHIQLDVEKEHKHRADMLRNLYYVFRDVALIDYPHDCVEGLVSSLSDQPIGKKARLYGVQSVFDTWETEFVYPADRERYRAFAQTARFVERLREAPGGMVHGYFRSKDIDGRYDWLQHILFCVPRTNFEQVLYVTLDAGLDIDEMRDILSREGIDVADGADLPRQANLRGISERTLWRSVMQGSYAKFFWKDRERRFLGASQKFLDFYGLESQDGLIGKTDEDMCWHIEAEPFMKDELAVIERGAIVKNVRGRCIARGRAREIVVNKMPLYDDGKIVGLVGNFIDVEDLAEPNRDPERLLLEDQITGLANTRGIIEGIGEFFEELWTKGVQFSVISVFTREYEAFAKSYGTAAGNALLEKIARVLEDEFADHAVVGRIAGSQFLIVVQYEKKDEIEAAADRVRGHIRTIHQAGEWPCTCTGDVVAHFIKGGTSNDRMLATLINAMISSFSE